ncbi:MAG: glycosyltransferase family 2 protein [Bacteroidota bacterium]
MFNTKDKTPFFSVVIPTFNRSAFIEATVCSVFQQSFQDFEIIVVDDGSTDDTASKLDVLKKINEAKFRCIHQKNEERGKARNVGIKNAQGKYIVFLDSDDRMLENHLQVLYKHIQQQPNLGFIATKYELRSLEASELLGAPLKKFRQGFYDYTILIDGNHFACNFAVCKEKLVYLFEENRAYASVEDWIFLMRNLQQQKIFLADELTITMIDHAGRSMKNHPLRIERKIKTAIYLLTKMRLTVKEQKKLLGYAYYHCSIHAYLMFNRTEAFQLLKKAIQYLGINSKVAYMGIRNFVGRRNINFMKTCLWDSTRHLQRSFL